MESAINLQSVLIADLIGAFILVVLLVTRGWSLPTRKEESRIMVVLIVASLFNCGVDLAVFAFDGKPGAICFLIELLGNTYLFLYALIIGVGLIYVVLKHIDHETRGMHMVIYWSMCVTGAVLLLINFVFPAVFEIDENNSYIRGPCYLMFVILGFGLCFYGVIYYIVNKIKTPTLRYFPVYEFIAPVLFGNFIQMKNYGISLLPVSFAISFAAIVISLQNECIYVDKLTGVYNRYELDKVLKVRQFRRKEKIAMLMFDLNDFKTINDKYSHDEGDKALIAFAECLMQVVGNKGIVIRFAGDEFFIFIRKADNVDLEDYKKRVYAKLDEYNANSGKPYKLVTAIGSKIFDLNRDNGNDLLKQVDKLMYADKAEYYKTHDRRKKPTTAAAKTTSEKPA